MSFADRIRERARGGGVRLVLPEGEDDRVREAAGRLLDEELAGEVLLVGGEEAPSRADLTPIDPGFPPEGDRMARELAEGSEDTSPDEAADRLEHPLYLGAALVRFGRADGMVAGAIHATGEVVRASLTVIGTAPDVSLASSSFIMDLPERPNRPAERLLFTDAGVVPDPDPDELAQIAGSAVALHRDLLAEDPRVAFLSFSTHGSADHPMTQRVREAAERFHERHPGVPADGELQGDAALVPEVARRKAPDGPLEGNANILVFPDLNAGNIAYKLVQRLANAGAYGPLLQGIDAPVNDLSRGCSVEDVVTVGAVTAVQAANGPAA